MSTTIDHMPSTLPNWLAHCERLHPSSIDMGLARVGQVAKRMNLHFDCPVITVAGTNGKGSTCAMLESILSEGGYRTGVYTSPHLVHFEERCRIGRQVVDAASLCTHFAKVEAARLGSFKASEAQASVAAASALAAPAPTVEASADAGHGAISLSYFEFSTLAILSLMSTSKLDVAILEVGLGGRLDATNIIDCDCAIITSIDLDHTELLGKDRESIGFEKAGILRAGKPAIVSDPLPPQSIIRHAKDIGADLWLLSRDYHLGGDKQQWAWSAAKSRSGRQYAGLAYPALRGANQLINAAGVLAALDALRPLLPVPAQAIRNGFAFVELPGRFQILPGQPTLVLDVAHNPHSVAALVANLDAMGYHPRTHAVFGAMADKDLATMLARILPLVDSWYVCDLPTPRAASAAALQSSIEAQLVHLPHRATGLPSISQHSSASKALQMALESSVAADRIVVFGSFYTVGGVLAEGLPALNAPHATPHIPPSTPSTLPRSQS